MTKFLNLSDPSFSPEIRDTLSPADVCDDEACGDGSVNSLDRPDGYLTVDEIEAHWGSVGSFQKTLGKGFGLFADFYEGKLVPVGWDQKRGYILTISTEDLRQLPEQGGELYAVDAQRGDIYRLWLGEQEREQVLYFARDDMPVMEVGIPPYTLSRIREIPTLSKDPKSESIRELSSQDGGIKLEWTQERVEDSELITVLAGVNVEASINAIAGVLTVIGGLKSKRKVSNVVLYETQQQQQEAFKRYSSMQSDTIRVPEEITRRNVTVTSTSIPRVRLGPTLVPQERDVIDLVEGKNEAWFPEVGRSSPKRVEAPESLTEGVQTKTMSPQDRAVEGLLNPTPTLESTALTLAEPSTSKVIDADVPSPPKTSGPLRVAMPKIGPIPPAILSGHPSAEERTAELAAGDVALGLGNEDFKPKNGSGTGSSDESLSPEEQDLLDRFIRYYPTYAEQALNAAKEAVFSSYWIVDLFKRMIEKTGHRNGEKNLLVLLAALEAARKAGFNADQIVSFFERIAKKAQEHSAWSFECLPATLEAAKKSGLNTDQIFSLIEWIVKEIKKSDVAHAFKVLPAVLEAGLNADQIVSLFEQIVKKKEHCLKYVFEALPATLEAARKAGLNTDQIVSLFERIVENSGMLTDAFRALPVVLEAGLNADQIVSLFERMVKIAANNNSTYKTFRALPAVLKAGFNADQIVSLFDRIVKEENKNGMHAFEALPTALEAARKAGLNTDQIVSLFERMVENAKNRTESVFKDLPAVLEAARKAGLNTDQIVSLFERIVKKTENSAVYAYSAILAILKNADPESVDGILSSFFRLLAKLNDYNRSWVLSLIGRRKGQFDEMGKRHFPDHLELYATVFERWPRLGYAVLDGLLEATDKGIIPAELTPEIKADIFHYIAQTNGFIPAIYRRYLAEGESLFPKLRAHAQAMLTDTLGSAEIGQIRKTEGDDYLLAVIQMVSPTSGASFVKQEEQLDLMERVIKAGDLRKDVPAAWRGQVKSFSLTQGEHVLKKGVQADSEGKLTDLLQGFQKTGVGEKTPTTREDLVLALKDYLEAISPKVVVSGADVNLALPDNKKKAAALKKVQEQLYALAGQDEGFKQKLQSISGTDYTSLGRLHELFNDKDNLPVFLSEAIKAADPALDVTKIKQMMDVILAWPRRLIRAEQEKYEYRQAEALKVGIRPVKGPAFGLYGLNAGVCVADDISVWTNPNFKLFAITDENSGTVGGYIQVFETTIDGKKYLTLPGINPSTEFLGTVDARQLYKGMIEQVIQFAKEGDYSGVYIPIEPNIHSNRSDIQREIVKNKYPIKEIPKVDWNTLPKPYPFTEVYEVWRR